MEAIVVIVTLSTLVWGAVVFLRGGLLAGGIMVLLAGICFGYPFFHWGEALPLTSDRILWVVLVTQYLVWRRFGRADPKPLGKAEFLLLAFTAVLAISTFTHDWQMHRAQPIARLVLFYVMPLGLYWIARQSAISERGVLTVVGCLTLLGVYLAVTALAEMFGAEWMVFPRYIMSPQWPEFLGRGRGPLLNPIGNGLLLGICLAACLVWWPRANQAGKLLLVAVCLLLGLGIYSTLTRSVWMGAGLGAAVVVILAAPRTVRVGLASCGLLAAILLATQWEHWVAFKRDRDLSAAATAESVELRPILAQVAWKMFLDRPLLGCGLGQYRSENVNYLADRSTELPLEKARPFVQHNVFLSLLTETGLVGLALFVAVLGLWTRDAWRLWHNPRAGLAVRQFALVVLALIANYVVNGMFHDVSIIVMVHALAFFLAGINAGLVGRIANPSCNP